MMTPPPDCRRRPFNMIEIVLALAVVGIGVLAVLSLIPIGAKAARDARGMSVASDAAANVFNYLVLRLNQDWTNTVNSIPEDPVDLSPLPDPGDLAAWTEVTELDMGTARLFRRAYGGFNVYRLVLQSNQQGFRTVTEVDAIIRVWKNPTEAAYYNAAWTTATDTTYQRRIQLNMEIGWPTQSPFDVRHRALYCFEVANLQ